jgi:Flp pilus assembly protein TadD
VHNTFGTLWQAIGEMKRARQAYERAVELDPGAAYALNNLCYVQTLEGHSGEAVSSCTAALVAEPRLTAARHNLALARAVNGDVEGARREFAKLGDDGQVLYNVGIVHLAQRRFEAAARAFTEAYRVKPSLRLARARAAQAEALTHGETAGERQDGRND